MSPIIDMHFYLRTMLSKSSAEIPPAFRDAMAVLRDIDAKSKSGGPSWGMIESSLYDRQTAKDVLEVFSGLPETFKPRFPRNAKEIPLRALAVKLAGQYVALEPIFLRDYWPKRRAKIKTNLADINANFMPKSAQCFAYMLEHFGMDDPHAVIPVYLIVEMPFPGAHTYRRYGGGGMSIISVGPEVYRGSLLSESILHEATHALDMATSGHNVFEAMRKRLSDAGLSRRNDLFRDVPHTVYFVQAAETIRRIVDPKHEHYGVVSRYYDRVSKPNIPIGQKVRDVWTSYLDGKISRDVAVDELVKWTVEKTK